MNNLFRYEQLKQETVTAEQFKQVLEVEFSGNEPYPAEVIKQIYVEDKKDVNFVCVDNSTNKIIAHIATNPQSKRRNGSVFVVNLIVSPNYRRLGVAQNLIYTACKHYLAQGETKVMSISVDKINQPAINLYKKVGFEIKDPICPADEDDEQYILAAEMPTLVKTIEALNKGKEK